MGVLMRPTKEAALASPSTLKWWSCPGLVYFLSVGDPPIAVKIGMLAITAGHSAATAMRRRLATIQCSNHEIVRVLSTIRFESGPYPTKDAEDTERRLHQEFVHLARFKSGTRGAEWFSAAPDLLHRIAELAGPPLTSSDDPAAGPAS